VLEFLERVICFIWIKITLTPGPFTSAFDEGPTYVRKMEFLWLTTDNVNTDARLNLDAGFAGNYLHGVATNFYGY
jgi:hypothetical protein